MQLFEAVEAQDTTHTGAPYPAFTIGLTEPLPALLVLSHIPNILCVSLPESTRVAHSCPTPFTFRVPAAAVSAWATRSAFAVVSTVLAFAEPILRQRAGLTPGPESRG